MRSRITIRDNRILRGRHDVSVEHEQGTERMITSLASLSSQRDGLHGKPLVNVVVHG